MAFRSLKANFLRTFLTLLVIAVGITCLVGILTAIDSFLFSMSDSFSRLGANSYNIRPKSEQIQTRGQGRTIKRADPISFDQAMTFKEKLDFPGAKVSIEDPCGDRNEIQFGDEKTNPTIILYGIDENYFDVMAYDLQEGRNFTDSEIKSGSPKVIIGMGIVDKIFNENPKAAMNKVISVNADRYKVIGVLKEKGSSVNDKSDDRVFIPLGSSVAKYGYAKKNYRVNVAVEDATQMDNAISAAIIPLRNIRGLKPGKENDFEIRKSDSVLKQLQEMTSGIRLGTIVIAMMTLLGAAIGLMNIMLVSVTERTKEIGVCKALGAKRRNILTQFLTEAVVICQAGGLVGIVLGIALGNGVSMIMDGPFVVPWNWMLLALMVCLAVGVISGLYPAMKAARLDPIESLRYE